MTQHLRHGRLGHGELCAPADLRQDGLPHDRPDHVVVLGGRAARVLQREQEQRPEGVAAEEGVAGVEGGGDLAGEGDGRRGGVQGEAVRVQELVERERSLFELGFQSIRQYTSTNLRFDYLRNLRMLNTNEVLKLLLLPSRVGIFLHVPTCTFW